MAVMKKLRNEAVFPSVEALARELGIGLNAAYEGLKNGSIPSIRVSKKYIIPRSAIQEWLRTAGGKVA
jgi:excisionase family DNA binding protein